MRRALLKYYLKEEAGGDQNSRAGLSPGELSYGANPVCSGGRVIRYRGLPLLGEITRPRSDARPSRSKIP